MLLLRQRGSFCKTANWKYRQQALILHFGTKGEPRVANYTMSVKHALYCGRADLVPAIRFDRMTSWL